MSACTHCGTPISMLDAEHISEMVSQLQLGVLAKPIDVSALFAALKAGDERAEPQGLVETGFHLVANWLTSEA